MATTKPHVFAAQDRSYRAVAAIVAVAGVLFRRVRGGELVVRSAEPDQRLRRWFAGAKL